ncbi:hypothetical protein Cst04h_26380 [Corynebacterium striatum]|uniref:Uncharacterized protein n=1 Tax=Corynebacterium striatum TaxID=43770 RepID=A0ABC9ZNA5_CORST|nr:hypothetical protein Cst04h_17400 [Corynebacterium striatum]GEA44468.1 hypothetical protein Cst04h_26380 [Corynebacterium striatum]
MVTELLSLRRISLNADTASSFSFAHDCDVCPSWHTQGLHTGIFAGPRQACRELALSTHSQPMSTPGYYMLSLERA